jgi:hypothetical protein
MADEHDKIIADAAEVYFESERKIRAISPGNWPALDDAAAERDYAYEKLRSAVNTRKASHSG